MGSCGTVLQYHIWPLGKIVVPTHQLCYSSYNTLMGVEENAEPALFHMKTMIYHQALVRIQKIQNKEKYFLLKLMLLKFTYGIFKYERKYLN